MIKRVGAVAALLYVVFSFNSCKKITEDQLNGLWKLTQVNIDTSNSKYLNQLPLFANGNNCCFYKVDFEKDDYVIAYYLTYDTFSRIAYGTWNLPAYNKVYIKLDNFIDGTFDILKPSLTHWELTSPANHISAFDNGVNPQFDTSYTKIEMYKI
jgi:hypothetical protein